MTRLRFAAVEPVGFAMPSCPRNELEVLLQASMDGFGAVQLAYERQDRFGLTMPIMMAFQGGVVDGVVAYQSTYPDGFDIEVSMWVGANDQPGLIRNHELFSDYLDELGVDHGHVVSEDDGHFQDGHSMRYIGIILPDVLRTASDHFSS